jgi:hypothetical protein
VKAVNATLQGFDDRGHYTGLHDDTVRGCVTLARLAKLLPRLAQNPSALCPPLVEVCPPNVILEGDEGRKILSISVTEPDAPLVLFQDPQEIPDPEAPLQAATLFIERYGVERPDLSRRDLLPLPKPPRADRCGRDGAADSGFDQRRIVLAEAWVDALARAHLLLLYGAAAVVALVLFFVVGRAVGTAFLWKLAAWFPVDEPSEMLALLSVALFAVALVWLMSRASWRIVIDQVTGLVMAKHGWRRVAAIPSERLGGFEAAPPGEPAEPVAGARRSERTTIYFVDAVGERIRALDLPQRALAEQLVRQANAALTRYRRMTTHGG